MKKPAEKRNKRPLREENMWKTQIPRTPKALFKSAFAPPLTTYETKGLELRSFLLHNVPSVKEVMESERAMGENVSGSVHWGGSLWSILPAAKIEKVGAQEVIGGLCRLRDEFLEAGKALSETEYLWRQAERSYGGQKVTVIGDALEIYYKEIEKTLGKFPSPTFVNELIQALELNLKKLPRK